MTSLNVGKCRHCDSILRNNDKGSAPYLLVETDNGRSEMALKRIR